MEKAREIWIFFAHKSHCCSRIFSVIIRANPLDLQRKKQRQEKTPTFARVNQRREVNYRAIQPHELSTETVLFSFPLNGRANYICRFQDLIKDAVSSTPG